MANTIKVKGFVSNGLAIHKDRKFVDSAINGEFHNGYTVCELDNIVEGIVGKNPVLDCNLKALVNYHDDLEAGKTVDVYIEWELSADKTKCLSAKLLEVKVSN